MYAHCDVSGHLPAAVHALSDSRLFDGVPACAAPCMESRIFSRCSSASFMVAVSSSMAVLVLFFAVRYCLMYPLVAKPPPTVPSRPPLYRMHRRASSGTSLDPNGAVPVSAADLHGGFRGHIHRLSVFIAGIVPFLRRRRCSDRTLRDLEPVSDSDVDFFVTQRFLSTKSAVNNSSNLLIFYKVMIKSRKTY